MVRFRDAAEWCRDGRAMRTRDIVRHADASVRYLVGNCPVTWSGADVRAFIQERITAELPFRTIEAILDHAEMVHDENRKLYRDVIGGRIK